MKKDDATEYCEVRSKKELEDHQKKGWEIVSSFNNGRYFKMKRHNLKTTKVKFKKENE